MDSIVRLVNTQEYNVVKKKLTLPPTKFIHVHHHWLHSERSSFPVISEWHKGEWFSAGESKAISPEEMNKRGWVWYAPALPPKHPNKDSLYVEDE